MADEFKHVSVGTDLSQAEWESTAGHVLNSQATGDVIYASSASQLTRLGIGSASQVLTVTGGIPAWASVAAGGFTLAGSDTTERTMTSATAADLVTVTGLTIPATTPMMVMMSYRKSAATHGPALGLKVNATVVQEAIYNNAGLHVLSAANEAQNYMMWFYIAARRTNYDRGIAGGFHGGGATAGTSGVVPESSVLTAAIPIATITDIIIRGDSDGTNTLAVHGVYVYTLGV